VPQVLGCGEGHQARERLPMVIGGQRGEALRLQQRPQDRPGCRLQYSSRLAFAGHLLDELTEFDARRAAIVRPAHAERVGLDPVSDRHRATPRGPLPFVRGAVLIVGHDPQPTTPTTGALRGWAAVALTPRPGGSVPAGLVIWAGTVVGRLLLRLIVNEGTTAAFVVVAALVLGLLQVGPRAGARARQRTPPSADPALTTPVNGTTRTCDRAGRDPS
jgi:hypothetical protein